MEESPGTNTKDNLEEVQGADGDSNDITDTKNSAEKISDANTRDGEEETEPAEPAAEATESSAEATESSAEPKGSTENIPATDGTENMEETPGTETRASQEGIIGAESRHSMKGISATGIDTRGSKQEIPGSDTRVSTEGIVIDAEANNSLEVLVTDYSMAKIPGSDARDSQEESLVAESSSEILPPNDKKIQTCPPLQARIEEWLEWDKNSITFDNISMLQEQDEKELLEELLMSRLEFGTAGLRGPMGPGYSRMNDLVVIQTTQGVCSYLMSTMKDAESQQGSAGTLQSLRSEASDDSWRKTGENSIAIGFDGRYNSKRFAELAATIFLNEGFIVYLFSELVPTPFVPYCVSYYKCLAGIMITASHNPKDDNGYKLYWSNGAQIIPPHDKHIQMDILANLKPWPRSWDTEKTMQTDQLRDPLAEIMSQYYSILTDNSLDLLINSESTIKITYTPMHGVGYRYMKAAFKAANFKDFKVVELQKFPDPEFPTVKFPNPEEGKSALDLAIATADSWGSTLILANDPDADRLAAAEQNDLIGTWRIYTGNELGALLGWWAFNVWAMKHKGESREDVYMLGSTVSTKFLQTLAKAEGFNFVETLTGFKWMGNRAYELKAAGKTVLFAFEEAIGFMYGTAVLDKDGISAGIFVAEMLAHLSRKEISLEDKLAQLYAKYGYHISNNSYFLCYNPMILKKIFKRLRTFHGEPDTYPDSILDGKYAISSIRDLTTGYDSAQPECKAILPISSSSQMITFTFVNGLVATLRTSGTEPKVKYYTELCASPEEDDENRLKETLQEMATAIIEEFLQPNLNNLTAREP